MDLLKCMLEKDPHQRISSEAALSHPAFEILMSKSPLIMRKAFDPNDLLNHKSITRELANKQARRDGLHKARPTNPEQN